MKGITKFKKPPSELEASTTPTNPKHASKPATLRKKCVSMREQLNHARHPPSTSLPGRSRRRRRSRRFSPTISAIEPVDLLSIGVDAMARQVPPHPSRTSLRGWRLWAMRVACLMSMWSKVNSCTMTRTLGWSLWNLSRRQFHYGSASPRQSAVGSQYVRCSRKES